jgi:hypothetical protein
MGGHGRIGTSLGVSKRTPNAGRTPWVRHTPWVAHT